MEDESFYRCASCNAPLFSTSAKFDAGTGYPSYDAPACAESIATVRRHSHGVERTQVLCATCEAHLGHVFDDTSQPTGKRYCIISSALDFAPNDT